MDEKRIALLQELRGRQIVADLEHAPEAPCTGCGHILCTHEMLFSMAMGFLREPTCVDCLARGVRKTRDAFLQDMLAFVGRQPCWQAGWAWASAREGFPDGTLPPCLGGSA